MSRIHSPALLVGSVPLSTVKDVLESCARELDGLVDSFPDGEVGERINWVYYLVVRTYRNHPALDLVQDGQGATITQPKPGSSLEERARSAITFRIRPGSENFEFGELQYSGPAIDSYREFVALREAGEIRSEARFQVCLPATGSAITTFFAEPDQWPVLYDAYRTAVSREVELMLEVIPAADLVIQFDLAAEVRDLYLGDRPPLPWSPAWTSEEKWRWHLADIAPLAAHVPEDVALGYHLCFGTWGGWPHTPGVEDIGVCVRLANELVARVPRQVDYIHLPVLPDCDESFVAPMAGLRLGDTRLYVGLAYHDGAEGSRRRIELIRRHVEDFGTGWYCGLGRLPQEEVAPILEHIRVSAEQVLTARSESQERR
jgi:hypothetical protein